MKIISRHKKGKPEPGIELAESDVYQQFSGLMGDAVQNYSATCSFPNTCNAIKPRIWRNLPPFVRRTIFELSGVKLPVRTVVIVLLVLTFPIWIGIAGGLFGLIFGLIGGFFGLIAGIIGGIFGAIGALFGAIFDVVFHPWHGWHGFHLSPFWFFVGVVLIVLLVRSRRQTR
jgi:MFS family permease